MSRTLADRPIRTTDAAIHDAFRLAGERYAALGVDVEDALRRLGETSISLHCWQGDDVRGFEPGEHELGGGLAVSGNYPGKPRNAAELRSDLEIALGLIPGRQRVNLHASYAETHGQRVDRNELAPEHFIGWIEWAKDLELALDFNPTFFSHRLADDGFTLSNADDAIRQFWIEHGIACRRVGAAMGAALGSPCITNLWIPDGFKDAPVDRVAPRQRLVAALDEVFAEPINPQFNVDAVESKLFGIGSESYVVGSHEFYLGYAATRQKMLCLDAGHFHPTESIADKISSTLMWTPALLLHMSRGVRWDSDHVVTLTDDLSAICQEIVRGDFLQRIHIGLDFFDGSINRVAAWAIGARNVQKALLAAMLEPIDRLRAAELAGDYTTRLALQEELKSLPAGAVWDYFCLAQDAPLGMGWLEAVKRYEERVLSQRS